MFNAYKFRDIHLQIPDFALLKQQYHKLEEMDWWLYNSNVYVCETDFDEDEFNPAKIIPKEESQSAIILIKGSVNSKLVSDYNYFNNRHDIIVLGDVNAGNFIVDKDYYFIGGDIKVDGLFYIPKNGEVCSEGGTKARLGILRTDYNLYSTNGYNFDILFGERSTLTIWDEPYPHDELARYLPKELLCDYKELGGTPDSWQKQVDITKLYNAIKENQALEVAEVDDFYLPEIKHIFEYGKICNKNDWQQQHENFTKLTNLLAQTGRKSIHFYVLGKHVTYLKEWGRDALPHIVIRIPDVGAMSITYNATKPNFVAKLLGNKEPEGMIAVLVHGAHDTVTQLWKDDCKIISMEEFNAIWFGILKSADAGIWHKTQFENAITVEKTKGILDSEYVINNFFQDSGASLSIDNNYFRFEKSDEEKSLQIGYEEKNEANNDGYDARFKYTIKTNEPNKIYLSQFIKDFDDYNYHTYFEEVPFIHWNSYRIAKRWFSWGEVILKIEENEWNEQINGFSNHVTLEDFNTIINHDIVDNLLETATENGWSDIFEFNDENNKYSARFYRADENCPRNVIRMQESNTDGDFDCSFIRIGTVITANKIYFDEDYAHLVQPINEFYHQDAINLFKILFKAITKQGIDTL